MVKRSLKEEIDMELRLLECNEIMKYKVIKHKKKKTHHILMKYAATIAVIIMLGGTTVFAGYFLLNRVNVNDKTLPELDSMEIVNVLPLDTEADEYGRVTVNFTDFNVIKTKLGIDVLDSELAKNNLCMIGEIRTDNKDFVMITIENYILGDTRNYQYLSDEKRYQYEHGTEYYSPISLSLDIILSESQLANGWDTDYLGMYEYMETYTSTQGYKVNLIQDTINEENDKEENYTSEKCSMFVADGIRYTLKGRTSLETMKAIIDTME